MKSFRITEIEPGQTIDFTAKSGTHVSELDPETMEYRTISDEDGKFLGFVRILGAVEVSKIESFVARSCGQTGRGKAQYRVELVDGRVFVSGIQEKFPILGT